MFETASEKNFVLASEMKIVTAKSFRSWKILKEMQEFWNMKRRKYFFLLTEVPQFLWTVSLFIVR